MGLSPKLFFQLTFVSDGTPYIAFWVFQKRTKSNLIRTFIGLCLQPGHTKEDIGEIGWGSWIGIYKQVCFELFSEGENCIAIEEVVLNMLLGRSFQMFGTSKTKL